MSSHDAVGSEPVFFDTLVARKHDAAQGVVLFELKPLPGRILPGFTAGSHLTVVTPSGVRRNYSLCGDPSDTGSYEIAVKRDAHGRGGSISMADDLQEGDTLQVSAPRNNFALVPRARSFIFVAGGIGITPVVSMVKHLHATGEAPFKLYYCTRDLEGTAFADELKQSGYASAVKIHHDHGSPDLAFDFWPIFEKPQSQVHIYCCGPKALMDAVQDMTGHWPSGSVHFESFGVDGKTFAENRPFAVRLQKSGARVEVAAGQTLLEALRACGHRVASSCESGTCGSCRTALISGEPEHRDMVLTDEEKRDQIMVCVSRSAGGELVLDL
jgi:phthalate 4,5-dioxygenase reductase subunit